MNLPPASWVHPTAIIDVQARLGRGVRVEAYVVVGAGVEVGDQCQLGPCCVLEGLTVLGSGNEVGTGAVLGGPPQDVGYRGEPTRLVIGSGNRIGPYVTISRGSPAGGGLTAVGSGCVLDYAAHVGHDCRVGDGVHLEALCALAGHVHVGDGARVGTLAGVHQFVHIGRMAVVEGHSKVDMDVPPFVHVGGNPARLLGFNEPALERLGSEESAAMRRALNLLYRSGLPLAEVMERLQAELSEVAAVRELLDFLRDSRRGVARQAGPGT